MVTLKGCHKVDSLSMSFVKYFTFFLEKIAGNLDKFANLR